MLFSEPGELVAASDINQFGRVDCTWTVYRQGQEAPV